MERGGHLRSVVVTPRDGRGVRTSGGLELAPQSDKKPQGFIGINEGNATVSVNPLRAIGDAGTALGQATSEEFSALVHVFSPSGISSLYHQVTNSHDASVAAQHPGTSERPVSLIGAGNIGVQALRQGVAVYEWIRTKKGQPYYQADITKLFPYLAPFLAFLAVFAISVIFLDIAHPLHNVFP